MRICVRRFITIEKCPAGIRVLAGFLLAALLTAARADTTYLAPDDFLHQTFGATLPKAQFLWLDDAAQARLKPIFGHAYPQARLRYWRADGKTAWILEDIGKEFPITAGFVVKDRAIDMARVLIYREARGDEIRYPSFLKQFSGAHLKDDQLDAGVDGISGATLSVGAMKRMARAALTLDSLAP
jgi:hypothetical protein